MEHSVSRITSRTPGRSPIRPAERGRRAEVAGPSRVNLIGTRLRQTSHDILMPRARLVYSYTT